MNKKIYSSKVSPTVQRKFVDWFKHQPDALKYEMACTEFNSKKRMGNLRRLMLSIFKAEDK